MISDRTAEDKAANGRLVEYEPPQKNIVSTVAYGLMEDKKIYSQISNNRYIHIKDTGNNVDVGDWSGRKAARDRNSKFILQSSTTRAERSLRTRGLADCFAAEVRFSRNLRSSTKPEIAVVDKHLAAVSVLPAIFHAHRVQP